MNDYDMVTKENVVLSHKELSPQDCEKTFGIEAGLSTAFQIGEQVFGVFKIDKPNCFPSSPSVSITTPYLILQFGRHMRVSLDNYKGLREGQKVILGRVDQSRFAFDQTVSRRHVEVSLKDGRVNVIDLGSTNGTKDVFNRVASLIKKDNEISSIRQGEVAGNTVFAKQVENHELTRTPDNDGRPLDQEYINNQTRVREFFVDAISDGSLYSDVSGENFSLKIQEAHGIANKNDVYGRVGAGSLNVENDQFRSDYGGLGNRRERQAREVASIANKYGDPYSRRFESSGDMKVRLAGIPDEFLPVDKNNDYMGYMFFYPSSEAIPAYMKQINNLGSEITKLTNSENRDTQQVAELIGKQYQYGAIIRPFNQINNSLFMNLANAQ
ncbi:FHA domain-containing protein, partial [Candidatus Dojkabacteria bacterium]|nr:FHA domain-containing protein [Candidatus Dojkabacteria bacterium]